MGNYDRYQEPLSDEFAKSFLRHDYNKEYDYFLIISVDKNVICGIRKDNPEDVVEYVYEEDPTRKDLTTSIKDSFIESGGKLEDYKSFKRKGNFIFAISLVVPIALCMLLCYTMMQVFK